VADSLLTSRRLNRATLARQMLLGRAAIPALEAIERLVGLQAQVAQPPYIGLWTRLEGFQRAHLDELLVQRRVVRATMMRSTLHLVSAEDYRSLRATLQPVLLRGLRSFRGRRIAGLDVGRLVRVARRAVEERPRTIAELRSLLSEVEPRFDPAALVLIVRAHLPLVQVPGGGAWGFPSVPSYALAERWIGRPLDALADTRALVLRYLLAFGPGSATDVQTWAGMGELDQAAEALGGELRTFRDERGARLLDLAGMPLPSADVRAPVRFLPEYDNVLLAHSDRARIVPDAYRFRVFLSAGRVRATFLVDGLVAGTWRIERSRSATTIRIEPFTSLRKDVRDALAVEGEALAGFLESGAPTRVRFTAA
jgi:hypothetical protein